MKRKGSLVLGGCVLRSTRGQRRADGRVHAAGGYLPGYRHRGPVDRARPGDGRRDPGGLSRTRPGDDGGRAPGAGRPPGASSPTGPPAATRADRDLGPRRGCSPSGSHGARRSASSGGCVSQRRSVGPLRTAEPEAARLSCPLGTRGFGLELSGLGATDYVDVQTFMWVTRGLDSRRPRPSSTTGMNGRSSEWAVVGGNERFVRLMRTSGGGLGG
jgi:hypothetical protein